MTARRPRLSRAQWREICTAYVASGMTAAKFASRRGVNPRTLAWWKSELNRTGELVSSTPGRGRFVEVVEESADQPVDTSCVFTVRLGEAELIFAELPPATWLAELIASC